MSLFSCQSKQTAEKSNIQSDIATRIAEALLLSQSNFAIARKDGTPLEMLDAALSRDTILSTDLYSVDSLAQIDATTQRMIDWTRLMASQDQQVQTEVEHRTASRSDRAKTNTSFLGQLGVFVHPNKYINKIQIRTKSSVTITLSIKAEFGAIIYVEHNIHEKIVLTIRTSSGVPICSDQNVQGFLICRWRPEQDQVATVTVENTGSINADILMIRNQ